jgi:hypothetical protein
MKEPITRAQLREFALQGSLLNILIAMESDSLVAQHMMVCAQIVHSAESLKRARREAIKNHAPPEHKLFHDQALNVAATAERAFDAAVELLYMMIMLNENCECERCVADRLNAKFDDQRENASWQ